MDELKAKFCVFMKGYGGAVPIGDLRGDHNTRRVEEAFRFIHEGWLKTAVSGSGSMLLKATDSGNAVLSAGV